MYVNHFPVQFQDCKGKNTKNEERRGCKTQKRTTPKRKNESKNTTLRIHTPREDTKTRLSAAFVDIDSLNTNHDVLASPQAKNEERTCWSSL